jgi:hypothetical protein
MEDAAKKNNKFSYHLLDMGDKCLVLKLDMTVGFSDACEIVAIFSPSKKVHAEKLIKDLNKSAAS